MSYEFSNEEPEPGIIEEQLEICFCGCSRQEHDEVTGQCLYCFEDDCAGFQIDEEATACAYAMALAQDVP